MLTILAKITEEVPVVTTLSRSTIYLLIFCLLDLSVANKHIDVSNYVIDLCLLSEVLSGFVYRFWHLVFRYINVKDVMS